MHNRVRYDHSRPSHDLAMSMRKCIWIGNHIKQLKEQFKQSDGSLCAIELSHIDTSKHWYSYFALFYRGSTKSDNRTST